MCDVEKERVRERERELDAQNTRKPLAAAISPSQEVKLITET